jgi:glycosyltransferase involved in cell wall biosynthesis
MRICLVGHKIHVHSRAADTGLLWPLARGLSERGHDVTIISTVSPLKKAEVYRDGIRAFYLQESASSYKTNRFIDAAHKKFTQLHNEKNFDLVHSLDDSALKIGRHKNNFNVTVAYDIEATKMAELFSTLTENDGSLNSQIKTSIKVGYKFLTSYFSQDRSLLQTADGIFTTTPQQRMILERYYLYPDYHTYTVPYGINLGDLTPRSESESFKLKLQIPDDAEIILTVSNFTNSFELRPLLKAFEKVVLKNSNTYLVIIGDGPRWKDVEYQMLKLVLGSRVIMPGSVDAEDLLNYISSSSIYVDLSSQSTGLEPSLIEAMAQKKVVIGSELSPISEIIEDTKDGFLVRPADDITLSKLLFQILIEKDRYQQIGEEARLKVLKVFNRQKMIDSLLQSYSEILEKSGRQNQRKNQREASQKKGLKNL